MVLWAVGLFVCPGCAGKKGGGDPAGAFSGGDSKLIVTPGTGLVGSVVRSIPADKFVVLNFPVGRMPAVEQRFNVYRRGLKVGEVRIAGPQYDDNIIADVVTGEASTGDQVRNN
jgi:hypothetical protein